MKHTPDIPALIIPPPMTTTYIQRETNIEAAPLVEESGNIVGRFCGEPTLREAVLVPATAADGSTTPLE